MSLPVSQLAVVENKLARKKWLTWLPIAAFALLWLDLIRQLSYVWAANEQYAYGWFVPIFALGLFLKKWPSRPPVEQPSTINHQPRILLSAFCILCLPFLLPLRVLYEINADWPLVSWPCALIVVGVTLYAVYLAGGWAWIKHFAFPVCFILVAVRWPWQLEHLVTQGLMRLDATITVELLGWSDIPANQHGNLIELANGTVGIDEACSGIRSFQSTLMAALFLGELYLLRWRTRSFLIVGGLGLAFAFNVARTLLLSWQANADGMSALKKWHDPAGFSIVIACFLVLWLIAVVVRRRATLRPLTSSSAPSSQFPASSSETISGLQTPLPVLARRFMFTCGFWSLFCILATEAWYRGDESADLGFIQWSVAMPKTEPRFQKVQLATNVTRLLKYDVGFAGEWRAENGFIWTVYFFRWEGKSMQSIMRARFHRPEVCLPAAGVPQVSIPEVDYFEAGPLKLPFTKATYAAQDRELLVFHCLWQDGDERRKGVRAYGRRDRLLMAIEGRRWIRQQVLMIVMTGYASAAEAERAVRQRLPDLIRVETHTIPAMSPIGQ